MSVIIIISFIVNMIPGGDDKRSGPRGFVLLGWAYQGGGGVMGVRVPLTAGA